MESPFHNNGSDSGSSSGSNDSYCMDTPSTPPQYCSISPKKTPLSPTAVLRDITNTSPSNFAHTKRGRQFDKISDRRSNSTSALYSFEDTPQAKKRHILTTSTPNLPDLTRLRRSPSAIIFDTIPVDTPEGSPEKKEDTESVHTNVERIPCILPVIPNSAPDYNRIDAYTVEALLRGDYGDKVESVRIWDCRYDYEYEGGHIQGAVLMCPEKITEIDMPDPPAKDQKRHIVILHCEFSSVRGPRCIHILRNLDRMVNMTRGNQWPQCSFPDVYLLEGGYKRFFETHKHLCTPQAYVAERSVEHQRTRANSKKTRKEQILRRSTSFSAYIPPSNKRALSHSTTCLNLNSFLADEPINDLHASQG